MKEALEILLSAEESANNRAAAFAEILNILFAYLLDFLGVETEEAE